MVLMAQEDGRDNWFAVSDAHKGMDISTFDSRNRDLKGKSFFNESWLFGHFIFEDGRLSESAHLLKYDLLEQQLIIKVEEGVFIVPLAEISGFILKNNFEITNTLATYTFVLKKLKGSSERVILERAIEGEYNLFIFNDVKLLEPNYVTALDAGRLRPKIIEKNKYYLQTNGDFLEIPARNKDAKKFFKKYPAAREYLKKNRIKVKSKEYLVALINFMNQ